MRKGSRCSRSRPETSSRIAQDELVLPRRISLERNAHEAGDLSGRPRRDEARLAAAMLAAVVSPELVPGADPRTPGRGIGGRAVDVEAAEQRRADGERAPGDDHWTRRTLERTRRVREPAAQDRGRHPPLPEGGHGEGVRQAPSSAPVPLAHHEPGLVVPGREIEAAREGVAIPQDLLPRLGEELHGQRLVVGKHPSALAMGHHQQQVEEVGEAAVAPLEGQIPNVHVDGHEHLHLARLLVPQDVGRHGERDVRRLEGGVEDAQQLGIDPTRLLRRRGLPLGKGVVARARTHLQPLAHLHRELVVAAVQLDGPVAEEVVRSGLRGYPFDSRREVVGVLDRKAAALERERLRPLRLQDQLLGGEGDIALEDGLGPLRLQLRRPGHEPAGVHEVEGRVRAARRLEDALELLQPGVVDEALRDQDQGLASFRRGQRTEGTLDHGQGLAGALPGLAVDLGRARPDDRVVEPGVVVVLPLAKVEGLVVGVDTLLPEASSHALPDHRVVEDVDPYGLVIAHAEVRGVGNVAALEVFQEGNELLSAPLHPGRPPRAAARRHDTHPIALADALSEEVRRGLLRVPGLRGGQVQLVEDDNEGAARRCRRSSAGRDDVRGGPLMLCGGRGRAAGGYLDGLEAGDRLRLSVLQDDEVVPAESRHRAARLVDDDGVDEHQLHAGGEAGSRARWPGRLGVSRAERERRDRKSDQSFHYRSPRTRRIPGSLLPQATPRSPARGRCRPEA